MSTASNVQSFSGVDARRSTRIQHPVTLIILGKNGMGQPFQEKTSSVAVNLHGCLYPSRHEYPVGSWVGLQVVPAGGESASALMRAQVRSIHAPESTRDLYQIGVELETPSNVWGVTSPPADWLHLLGDSRSTGPGAIGGEPSTSGGPSAPVSISGARTSSTATAFSKPGESSAPKTERFVITSDQLISAVRPKIQQAAEQAVSAAISTRLDEAVREALNKIDDVQRLNARQSSEISMQRVEALVLSSQQEMLTRLEERLAEVKTHWDEQQEVHRANIEGLSQGLDKMVCDIRRELTEAQQHIEGSLAIEPQSLDPRIKERLEVSVNRAAQDFESAAARVSDRHLVRLMEDKQMVAREAAAQLEARAAEARAMLHSAAGDAVDDFRRQLEAHVGQTLSEATQRATSSLAALEAENHSVVETRRRTLESDVARAGEQSAEQFRTGIKAFLYSCLVAAVSAVDEHSTSTLQGLVKEPGHNGKDKAENGKAAMHHFAMPSDTSDKGEN